MAERLTSDTVVIMDDPTQPTQFPITDRDLLELAKLATIENYIDLDDITLDYAPILPKRCLKKTCASILRMCRRSLHPT